MDEVLNGKRVLVVDDTAVTRMLVADILRASGVTLLEADTGEGALKVAREAPIDAFLLDIRLGDINGIELCRVLRAMEAYRVTPIVFVTAVDQREVLQWALDAGADDFIQKPIHAMVLRRRLGNLLQKAEYVQQMESMSLSLRQYVSPRTREVARAHAATRSLPPPRREQVCILFSDARGFTEMSQDMAPESLFDMLARHLAAQAELVYKHGGDIDKYSGDGIMAVFEGPGMAERACHCALEMLAHPPGPEGASIRVGIGIHQGEVMVGNLGSSEHLDYTIVGPAVNLAARLCGQANQSAIVSRAVRDAVGEDDALGFANERAAEIRGFREPVTVYELKARQPT